jgi:hypothetical protein
VSDDSKLIVFSTNRKDYKHLTIPIMMIDVFVIFALGTPNAEMRMPLTRLNTYCNTRTLLIAGAAAIL